MTEHEGSYCCTRAECNRVSLTRTSEGLACPNGHLFRFIPNTKVPVFARQPEDANEYAQKNAAEKHDNALAWLFSTFKQDEASVRTNLVAKLHLAKHHKILVTGAGTCNDLPYLKRGLGGQGTIYVQDFAQEMLQIGIERSRADNADSGVAVHYSVSDATDLPFADNSFDAAYHFGGINLFTDIRKGIAEMSRVVKTGGRVVIGDEGVAPWLENTEYGRMLIHNNSLYACKVPWEQIPESAREVQLSWQLGNCFYVIEFTVGEGPPPMTADVPHLGARGGSIRTRYFGQLEGIDPELRDKVYKEAASLGVSRVEYLESLLRAGLRRT